MSFINQIIVIIFLSAFLSVSSFSVNMPIAMRCCWVILQIFSQLDYCERKKRFGYLRMECQRHNLVKKAQLPVLPFQKNKLRRVQMVNRVGIWFTCNPVVLVAFRATLLHLSTAGTQRGTKLQPRNELKWLRASSLIIGALVMVFECLLFERHSFRRAFKRLPFIFFPFDLFHGRH